MRKNKLGKPCKDNAKFLYLLLVGVISFSLLQIAHAQTFPNSEMQVTLSDDLSNDHIAQDILKKIEQTKKMINDLKQKEYEENQAKENLQKMRDISVKLLNHDLGELERLWEKHSSRNSFEKFVNKKPSYVEGVFWDQFDFKEQKVNAGRIAMNEVLSNGGTMHDAQEAYNKAATTLRIELIEINAQINTKHNLANYEEQQLFNSEGQFHQSNATQAKLTNLYLDYAMQPNYILANLDSQPVLDIDLDAQCNEGLILVTRMISGNQSCVEESLAKKWLTNGVQGLVISQNDLDDSNDVQITPGTQCKEGHQVVYHLVDAEYQCVLVSDAKDMVEQNIAENHTFIDYIVSKDDLKIHEDAVYEINQKISKITKEYDLKYGTLELEYNKIIEHENWMAKQTTQEIIDEYKSGIISKEDVSKRISEIRKNNVITIENILEQKSYVVNLLELEQKNKILKLVNNHENNTGINVDWDYLNETIDVIPEQNEKNLSTSVEISLSEDDVGNIRLDDVDVVNSFGQKFDEIKSDQVLQIAADITNHNEHKHDFAYVLEITDSENNLTQPARWMTGTINPDQTFNISLSWMPEEVGEYTATLSVGTSIDSILQAADIKINVNPNGDISDDDYCKNDHELIFKYSDNSPICVSPDAAFKLVNTGLAFA